MIQNSKNLSARELKELEVSVSEADKNRQLAITLKDKDIEFEKTKASMGIRYKIPRLIILLPALIITLPILAIAVVRGRDIERYWTSLLD
jgi:uncharacterized membrane protein YhaH (DUF805 family)